MQTITHCFCGLGLINTQLV